MPAKPAVLQVALPASKSNPQTSAAALEGHRKPPNKPVLLLPPDLLAYKKCSPTKLKNSHCSNFHEPLQHHSRKGLIVKIQTAKRGLFSPIK
jgi:hypothetical protein